MEEIHIFNPAMKDYMCNVFVPLSLSLSPFAQT